MNIIFKIKFINTPRSKCIYIQEKTYKDLTVYIYLRNILYILFNWNFIRISECFMTYLIND